MIFAVDLAITLGASTLYAAPKKAHSQISFSRDIQPLLAEKCLLCHGVDEQEAGLRLDSFQLATAALESGERAVVPGKPKLSTLLARITSTDKDERMPPDGDPLSKEDIDDLRNWIESGAEYEVHWAYRPLAAPKPPPSNHTSIRNNIDRFVLTKLAAHRITPSPPAARITHIKRLYYDLLGLLPTPEEVDGFIADKSPAAYENLVDRLLASPHFGERWGRHWLDKARYADSDGYEKDKVRPNAWHYRDWVIRAINDDMPLDQFAIEQIAGDLLPKASDSQRLATAFHRQTLTNTEGGADKEEFRVAAVHDRTETIGAVWLGLTVGCARCHNHKYDQVSQKEYYQLFAFFNNGDETNMNLPVENDTAANKKPKQVAVRVISERKHRRKTHIFNRGDFLQPTKEVQPSTVSTMPPLTSRHKDRPADRLDLAHWLVRSNNPLPPRVIANQIFANLFGRGLIRTMNDFGVRGETPTHPLLLDHLASELIDRQWSRKSLIKYIVMSATYRQASVHRPELLARDPRNDLLYRQNRLRVEGELIRDLNLAAAGLLSKKIGGPSVFPRLPPGIAELSYANNFKWKESAGEDRYRRGMYTFFKRTSPHPDLLNFDCPDSNRTSVERTRSNTPLQALQSLNSQTHHEAVQALSRRVLSEKHTDDNARLVRAFRYCQVRVPVPAEIDELETLLTTCRKYYSAHDEDAKSVVGSYVTQNGDAHETAAWIATLRVLLNTDEFLTRE